MRIHIIVCIKLACLSHHDHHPFFRDDRHDVDGGMAGSAKLLEIVNAFVF